jgi:hypothetical protein
MKQCKGNAMIKHNFKNEPACPITNVRAINQIFVLDNAHVSYNPSSANYGCKTTAIVLKGRVFFILNGDHRAELSVIIPDKGIQGCIDYFIDNIDKVNDHSEHLMVIGKKNDLFELIPTAVYVIGQKNIDRIRNVIG